MDIYQKAAQTTPLSSTAIKGKKMWAFIYRHHQVKGGLHTCNY